MKRLAATIAVSVRCVFISSVSVATQAMAEESLKGTKPNIVLIMPDDISYGSIHAYGGTNPSPNIDALYRKGLRFEDFHVSPTCSPKRLGPNPRGSGHFSAQRTERPLLVLRSEQ